jgi:hypothetical protein
MTSHSRTAEREEERRLHLRTLVIASAASAAAALLTSQVSTAGTWVAAAMTPVIVSLVSEMLNRPTERIAKSFTSDRRSLAAAGGAGRPASPGVDPLPDRAPMEPAAGAREARPPVPGPGSEAPIRVYRAGEAQPRRSALGESEQAVGARGRAAGGRSQQAGGQQAGGRDEGGREAGGREAGLRQAGTPGKGAGGRGPDAAPGPAAGARGQGIGGHPQQPGSRGAVLGAPGVTTGGGRPTARRRKIAFGAVFGTAALAFVIAVAALTLPELVAGESVGNNDGRTTFFGGKKSNDRSKDQAPQNTTEQQEQQPQEEEQQQQPTTPEEETTPPAEEEPPAEETVPEPAPAPGEPLPETTPAPPTTQP